ncbi:hypothetical protein F383_01089 [Gossypium arboreum]|uniref:Uncharacterized protein n=1 Tax=Gossypium arboreum TaxID=29729 RepID=A0A0B0PH24_GOSAR|nr:hypothetical protein F383_01089 [Gossypium arboreum]
MEATTMEIWSGRMEQEALVTWRPYVGNHSWEPDLG